MDFVNIANGAELALAVTGSIVIGASLYCSKTATPVPGTTRAKIYAGIEFAAVMFGRAKEIGMVPPEPAVDAMVAKAEAFAEAVTVPKAAIRPAPTPAPSAPIVGLLLAAGLAGSLAACDALASAPAEVAAVQAKVTAVEQKVAPAVADACVRFEAADSNPLVKLIVAGGTIALDAETGGAAGPVIASIRSYGETFCTSGPPAGDTTTPEQQAQWLNGQITSQLLSLADIKTP